MIDFRHFGGGEDMEKQINLGEYNGKGLSDQDEIEAAPAGEQSEKEVENKTCPCAEPDYQRAFSADCILLAVAEVVYH